MVQSPTCGQLPVTHLGDCYGGQYCLSFLLRTSTRGWVPSQQTGLRGWYAGGQSSYSEILQQLGEMGWQKLPKVEASIWDRLTPYNRRGWGRWTSAVLSNPNCSLIQVTGGFSTSKKNLDKSGQPLPQSRLLVLILPIQQPEWLLPFQNIQYENNYPPGTTQLQVITIKVDKRR